MEVEVGKVTHYYNQINVAILSLVDGIKLGDKIHIVGHSTDITQWVTSLEVEYHSVVWVKPGDHVAIKVNRPVHEHDLVFRIVEDIPETII